MCRRTLSAHTVGEGKEGVGMQFEERLTPPGPQPPSLSSSPVSLPPFISQNWADNFISELNDTHIEADLRLRHAPPPVSGAEIERERG